MNPEKKALLEKGAFIPAHPLALHEDRTFDQRRQRALSRYYLAAGADGLAVGVHSTQFAIRQVGLYEPVLRVSAEEAKPETLLIAGVVGPTQQAVAEAEIAQKLGYDAVLLSCGSLPDFTETQLIKRAEAVAKVLPLFGFYLQPSAGGRLLSRSYWRDLADLPELVAIKMAPFNRYQTLDVLRGVCASSRRDQIALYTGNDDNIVVDLLTPFFIEADGQRYEKRIVGGLLGHWAAWTAASVKLFRDLQAKAAHTSIDSDMLTLAAQVTESNAAMFDAPNGYAGCIPGIHEILRRSGLLANLTTLNPHEKLSQGQSEEITRIGNAYPHLVDDAFVAAHLKDWLS